MSDLSTAATTVMARIEIGFATNGEVFLCSQFLGCKDRAFLPFPQADLISRVEALAAELRQQMVAELRNQLAACEGTLPSQE